jgi:NodT family efflux transporter outer membrane factor (OMF) lipoprotein
VQNDFRPVLSASYEIDWLGRVRRDVEAARADAEQAAADARGVRLLASAQLATAYFQLRGLDEEIDLAGRTGDAQKQVLDLSRERYEAGAASQAELSQQRALVEGTLAQLALLGLQRARAEDAIAVLVGAPASSFHVARAPLATAPPAIALLAPSRLLERRPDIASAERAMAAANARIGVARAARFPSLLLAPAFAGTESNAISTLFSAPALVWSLGAGLSQAVFDGGRNRAGVDVARAGYAAAAEQYRQSVLAGISEAEDALAAVRANAQAREMQDAAVHDTERAYEAGAARHREGLDSALTLALVQQNLLAARRAQAQVRTAQFLAAVDLVKALGGSWER